MGNNYPSWKVIVTNNSPHKICMNIFDSKSSSDHRGMHSQGMPQTCPKLKVTEPLRIARDHIYNLPALNWPITRSPIQDLGDRLLEPRIVKRALI